jgi:hypothetical protein
VVELSVLNWLVHSRFPVSTEVSILQVDLGLTDELVTEEEIIVHHLNGELWATREHSLEQELLIDVGIRFVLDIICSLVEDLLTKLENDERI